MLGAITLQPFDIEVRELAAPGPPEVDYLTLDVQMVGICGSDAHIYDGSMPGATYPIVQGHEICGRIRELPAGYSGPLQPGELVAVEPLIGCGRCYACRVGRYNCCTHLQTVGVHVGGGLQQQQNFPAALCHPVTGLTVQQATFCEPMSIGLHGVHRVDVRRDDRVLVFGAGLIGLSFVLASADRGAQVVAVSRSRERRQAAITLGAYAAIDPSDINSFLSSWTRSDGPTIVAEATGSRDIAKTAFDVIASGGRIAMIGVSADTLNVAMRTFTEKELAVFGVRGTRAFPEAVELVRRHAEVLEGLVTHRFRLNEAPNAFDLLGRHPSDVIKVSIEVAATTEM